MVKNVSCRRIFNSVQKNRLRGYSTGQLLFGRDMILPIKHKLDWESLCHKKQTQTNKYNTHKHIRQVDHDYNVGYKVMLDNYSAYKYKTPNKGLFVITQCLTNDTVTL